MVSVTRPVILQQEGERFPAAAAASCSSGVHCTRGRTDRFDVSKYLLSAEFVCVFSLTCSLHIQGQMFPRRRRAVE